MHRYFRLYEKIAQSYIDDLEVSLEDTQYYDVFLKYIKEFLPDERTYIPFSNVKTQGGVTSSGVENRIKEYADADPDIEFDDALFKDGFLWDKKNKREIKIGKALKKLDDKEKQEILNDYSKERAKTGLKDEKLLICVSRKIIDIAGQSTDRAWTSCKNLGSGVVEDAEYEPTARPGLYAKKVINDVEYGVLVAYLIKSSDKNIQRPLARTLIIPYYPRQDYNQMPYYKVSYTGSNFRVYGSGASLVEVQFAKQLNKWCIAKQRKLRDRNTAYILPSEIYSDEVSKIIGNRIWKDGTWKDGNWEDGTWEDGVWENGIWKDGEWRGGIWYGGEWKDGTWKDGEWQDGIWYKGTWYQGTWNKGRWFDGIWKNGGWLDGLWIDGTWHEGTWENGIWHDGIWHNGEWEEGRWHEGTWYGGTWKDGVWHNGLWRNGTWEDGEWEDGEWEEGIWKDGVWFKGTWEDGEWRGGTWGVGRIYSKRFGSYITSKVNPKEFYKLEDESDTIEELEDMVT